MRTEPAPLPQGEAKVRAVRSMFDAIAPRYDLVNRVMTFRMDVGWRRRTVRALGLPAGSRVLDLACGTGDLCRELVVPLVSPPMNTASTGRRSQGRSVPSLALPYWRDRGRRERRPGPSDSRHDLRAVPLAAGGHRPVGVDLSEGMLRAARTTAPLVHADILHLPTRDGAADGATCGFALRNLVALEPFFAELARAVRPGGRIALLEVAEPPNRFLRWGHRLYFGKVVPWVGGLLSDPAAYRYLPKSVAYLPEPDELMRQLRAAGFSDATRTLLSTGIAQLLVATRDPA